MSNQLLPCPFCGHDEPTHDEGDQSAWVQCTNFECGMCGPIASGPSLAAAAWNRRAAQPAAGEPKPIAYVNYAANGQPYLDWLPGGQDESHALFGAPPAAAHGDEYPSEQKLEASGLGYPLSKEEAVQLWYQGLRSEVITVLEAWQAIGNDIDVNPGKDELLESLRHMRQLVEQVEAGEYQQYISAADFVRRKAISIPGHGDLLSGLADELSKVIPASAAHGDEAVAVVGTVPDGSGFKSLDFKVDLQDLPDGTRLYTQGAGGAST